MLWLCSAAIDVICFRCCMLLLIVVVVVVVVVVAVVDVVLVSFCWCRDYFKLLLILSIYFRCFMLLLIVVVVAVVVVVFADAFVVIICYNFFNLLSLLLLLLLLFFFNYLLDVVFLIFHYRMFQLSLWSPWSYSIINHSRAICLNDLLINLLSGLKDKYYVFCGTQTY